MASEALHEGANAKLVLPLLSYIFSQIEIEELE